MALTFTLPVASVKAIRAIVRSGIVMALPTLWVDHACVNRIVESFPRQFARVG
jgi:hypothetical protein